MLLARFVWPLAFGLPLEKDFNIQLRLPGSNENDPRVINNINIIINVGQADDNADLESSEENLQTPLLETSSISTQLEKTTSSYNELTTVAEKIADNYTSTDTDISSATTSTLPSLEASENDTVSDTFYSTVGATTEPPWTAMMSSTTSMNSETSAITSIAPETSLTEPVGTGDEILGSEQNISTTTAIYDPQISTIADRVTISSNYGEKSSNKDADISSIDLGNFSEERTTQAPRMNSTEPHFLSSTSVATPAPSTGTERHATLNTTPDYQNDNDERDEKVTNSTEILKTAGTITYSFTSAAEDLTSTSVSALEPTWEISNQTQLSKVEQEATTIAPVSETTKFQMVNESATSSESLSTRPDETTEGTRNDVIDTTDGTTEKFLGMGF